MKNCQGLIEYALPCTVFLGSRSSIHPLKLQMCCVFVHVWVGVGVRVCVCALECLCADMCDCTTNKCMFARVPVSVRGSSSAMSKTISPTVLLTCFSSKNKTDI